MWQVLEKATEAQGVLVTAGEGGCSYAFHSAEGSSEVHKAFIPILSVDVVETTGAGDAFLAGFLFGLVNVRRSSRLPVMAPKCTLCPGSMCKCLPKSKNQYEVELHHATAFLRRAMHATSLLADLVCTCKEQAGRGISR